MSGRSEDQLRIQTEVREADAGRIAVLHLHGEVDLANAQDLEAALDVEPCQSCHGVVIDLLGVTFMDSSGLRVLLLLSNGTTRAALVVEPDSLVMRLLGFAEMAELFPVHPTVDAAVAALEVR